MKFLDNKRLYFNQRNKEPSYLDVRVQYAVIPTAVLCQRVLIADTIRRSQPSDWLNGRNWALTAT